jgi:hypothetical protein
MTNPPKVPRKKVKSVYYVNPKELKEEIAKYKIDGNISEALGHFIMLIAKNFVSKGNFRNYSYVDDFVGDAIYRMIEQLNKLNLDHPKCNCFAYLTQVCYRCFQARIIKEGKFTRLKECLTDHMFEQLENSEHISFRKNMKEDEQNDKIDK